MSSFRNVMARIRILSLCLIFNLLSVATYALDFSVGSLNYTVNPDGKTVTLTGYNKRLNGTLKIQSTVTNNGIKYTVTAIGPDAFLSKNGSPQFNCAEIIIPGTIKTIGMSAFKNRTTIKTITFEEGLEVIGAGAFEGLSNLSKITLPKSLTTVEAHAFKNCPSLCSVTVLGSPAILSDNGCKAGEATGRDHCDWFNSRDEDCQKLTPPQTCSHCANPILKVPPEYYEEYFKNPEWNYEFNRITSDLQINDCLHLEVADKIYDGTNVITTENIDFNQTCDYFSEEFLREYVFYVKRFEANGVNVNPPGQPYEAVVTIGYKDKVRLPSLNKSTVTGTYNILPKTLTFDGETVVLPKTYDGTTAVDPSTITLPNLVGIVGDDDVRLEIVETPQMESKDINTDPKVNGGLNVIPSIKVRLVGSKAGNYVLESDEIQNVLVKVNPRNLNVTCDNISVDSKVYDGKSDFKKKYFTLPSEFGLLDGDDLTMEPVASAPSANVGEYTVQIGIYFTGDDQMKANYGVSDYSKKNPYLTCTKTLKITPKKITNIKYDLSVADHTYDCSFDDTDDVTVSNVVFAKDELLDSGVDLIVRSATLADKNVTGSQTSTTIVLALTGNNSGNYQLELPNDGVVVKSTRVVPAKLSVVGQPKLANHTYDGTTDCMANVDIKGVSLSGFSCDDAASASIVSAVLSQKNASVECVGDSVGGVLANVTVKFVGGNLSNYTIEGLNPDGTYTFKGLPTDIEPRVVSIDISKTTIDDKIYNGKKTLDPSSIHYVASVPNAIKGDDVSAELVSAIMGTKRVGRNLVMIKSRLAGSSAANYTLASCQKEQTNFYNIEIKPRKINLLDYDLIADTIPFNCSGSVDVSIAAKLPDESLYLQYDENGNPDDFHVATDNIVFYKNSEGTYVAIITLKKWGSDDVNYELDHSNQFTENIILTPKEDVKVDFSGVANTNISHVFDCEYDVTADYNGPKKLPISGLCPIGTSQPDVYYQFKSATITDNPNVGEGHTTRLVFSLAGSSLSDSNFDRTLYNLKDEIEVTEGISTRVTPASVSADFSQLPKRMTHAYDGKNVFTDSELKGYSLSPVAISSPCANAAYEIQSVVIDKYDVCDDATATLTYKVVNADTQTLINLGLTTDVLVKTIPTSITPKELAVNVTMPSCHVYDRKKEVTESELSMTLTKIASPNGKKDDVKLALSSAVLDSPEVGENHTLTVKLYLIGSKASNYVLPNNGVFILNNVEVCAAELEVKGSVAFNDHVYDCGVDAKADIKSYPYVEIGTRTIKLQFDSDDYAKISNKNCGERTVQIRLSLVGQPNYKLKGGVGASSSKIILTAPISVVQRHLSLSGVGVASPHTYDCSNVCNGSVTVPSLSNVSCNEQVGLKVVSALFADGAYSVGTRNLNVTYALDGMSSVISNYVLDNPVQVIKATVEPKPVSYSDPDFNTPVAHKYNCDNLSDVKSDYLLLYPERINVVGYCGDDPIYYVLSSATITDADKTPGTGRETTVIYKLNSTASSAIGNYSGLPLQITYKITTDISKPDPGVYAEPRFTAVDHQYVCGETGDVTAEYKSSAFASIPVSNVCGNIVNYVLESAQVLSDDLTPANNLKTRVTYRLKANSSDFDPEDFSLPLTISFESALTNITKPNPATFVNPAFRQVNHKFVCAGETGDVTAEYLAVDSYKRIAVSGVCGADVYYELLRAQITESDIVPGKVYGTEVLYNLITPSGFDASDFGLSSTLKFATALTNVTYPDPAVFSKPSFSPVSHQFECGDNGDVTEDFKKSDYSSITVSNVCGTTARYVLRSAQVIGTDFMPSTNRPTTVVYDLVMPEGYIADYYGLESVLTYTDALTDITKPSPASVASPVFTPVHHVYECNDDGDVTSEYKAAYGALSVSGVCGLDFSYVLESARIAGSDFTPKDGRATSVTYRLVIPEGADPDIFSLSRTISYDNAVTNVVNPQPANYILPDFKPVDIIFVCGFNGDVTDAFAAAGYGVISVSGVCGADVKYKLVSATVPGSDFKPADGLQTGLVYDLVFPSGFNPDIFGLDREITVDNAQTNIKRPAPAIIERPVFTSVSHKYVCGETGDVTPEFLNSRFATVKVSDICGQTAYYKLRSAVVTADDLTPADNLPTKVVYDLVMPTDYDAEDFGLPLEVSYADALTNITKPDPATFTAPMFSTVQHKYDCADTGDVIDDYKNQTFSKIIVSGVCGADVYYELSSAEIADKSDLTPALGLRTTVSYELRYPDGFDPSDFGLSHTLVFTEATTDVVASDAASFTNPVFTPVDHQYVCDEDGIVTAEYKNVSEWDRIYVSGVCRDDVYYELEKAEIIDKSDLTPADNLPTEVTYRIRPSDFVYTDFGLSQTLVFNTALTNITKPQPAQFDAPEFTAVRHQFVCGDSGDVTEEYKESKYSSIPVTGVCGNAVYYRLDNAVITDPDKTPGENRPTDVTYVLDYPQQFNPEDFGLELSIVFHNALTTVTNPMPAVYDKPLFSAVEHQYQCNETGDVTAEFLASKFKRIDVSNVCGSDVYYEVASANVIADDLTPALALPTTVVYKLHYSDDFVPDEFGLAMSIKYDDAITDITKPEPATFAKPSFLPVNHKYVCGDNGDVKADYEPEYNIIEVDGVCGKAYYTLVSAQINGADFTPADGLSTTVTYALTMPEGQDAADYGLSETISFNDAVTNVTKPDAATFDKPDFTPVDHQYQCNDNGDVTLQYQASVFGVINVRNVCGEAVTYQLYKAQIQGSDFTPADNLPTTAYYRLHAPANFDRTDFGLEEEVVFYNALTNVTKPQPAGYVEPKFEVVEHDFKCDDDGDVTAEYLASGYRVIEVSGICDKYVCYRLVSANILGSDFTPADSLATRVVYELEKPDGYNPQDFGLQLKLTFDNALTTIVKPEKPTISIPVFTPVDHNFVCDDDGDVTEDYQKSQFNEIAVSDICGRKVYYKLKNASILSKDLSPAENLLTSLEYELVMPAGFDSEDFGLSATISCDGLTNILKPAPATFSKPGFSAVTHVYDCPDRGDVTKEYQASEFSTIQVSDICGNKVSYSLVSATILGTDFTPAENLPTDVVYVLNMPAGFEAADFGLETTIKYTDALTTVLKPSPATFDAPQFTTVEHQYRCGDNGDVTDDYKKSDFNVITVDNICVDFAEYVISNATVIGSDFAPATGKATKVTYKLRISDGFDPDDFGLADSITYTSAITDITKPEAASFQKPLFSPVSHNFKCDDDGDVTPEFKNAYPTVEVSGICGLSVYYSLDSAIITSDDLNPAENLSTNVYYSLVMPKGYKAEDYGLERNIVYTDALTTIERPDPAEVFDPVFTPVEHKYSCDWDGDVTTDFLNSKFAQVSVSDVCGHEVLYQLTSAKVVADDLTPATGLPTSLVYKLVMPEGYNPEDFGLALQRTYNNALTDVTLPDPATYEVPNFAPIIHKYVCSENGDVFSEFNDSEYRSIKVNGVCCDSVRYELVKAYVTADDKTPADGLATELVYNLVMPCGDPEDFALSRTLTISNALTNITKPDAAEVLKPDFKVVTHKLDCDFSTDVTSDYLPVYGSISVEGVCGSNVSYVLKKAYIRGAMSPAKGVPTTLEYELDMPVGYDAEDFGLSAKLYYDDALTDIIKPDSASFKLPDFKPVDHNFGCADEDGDVTTDYQNPPFATITVSGVCDEEVYYRLVSAQIDGEDFTPADNMPTTLNYELVIPSSYSPEDYGLEENLVVRDAMTNILKPAPAVFSKPKFAVVDHDFSCDDDGDVTSEFQNSAYASIEIDGICGETGHYELTNAVILSSDLTPADSLPTRVTYRLVMPAGYDAEDFGLSAEVTFYDALTHILKPAPATFDAPQFKTVDHQYVCDENGDVLSDYQREGYSNFAVNGVCDIHPSYVLKYAQVLEKDLTPADNLPTRLIYGLVGMEGFDPSDFGLLSELEYDAFTNIKKPEPAVFAKPDFTPVVHQYACGDNGDVTADYLLSKFATIEVSGVCNQVVSYKLVSATVHGSDFLPSSGRLTTVVYELTPVSGYDPDDYGLSLTVSYADALTDISKPQPAHVEMPEFTPVDHKFECEDDGNVTTDYINAGFGSIKVSGICGQDVHYDLASAVISSDDVTPADGLLTKAVYILVMPEGYRLEDYGLEGELIIDSLLTNVTLPDRATFDKPDFTVVNHKYECGDNGDVTVEYKNSEFAKIDIFGVCGQTAYYELEKAVINQDDVTPADSLPTTLSYVLVMPDGYDPADFQLAANVSYSDALTNVLKPDPATFDAPTLPAISHIYDCSPNVSVDFTGTSVIPVRGLCGVDDGTVYYEFESAYIMGDVCTPSETPYQTEVTYSLNGVPDFIDINDFGLSEQLIFDTVETTVKPKVVSVDCFADVKLKHTFDCSPDVAKDVPNEFIIIRVPNDQLCDGVNARYELSAASIADGESYSVGLNNATRLTYRIAGLDGDQLDYYTLSPELICLATTDVVQANVGFSEPAVPQMLSHEYNCSPEVLSDYVAAGGDERINVSGLCGFEGVDVFYSLESAIMVSDYAEFTPSVTPYKTVVSYVLNNISEDDASLFGLPYRFTRETYTEVKPTSVTVNCPADLNKSFSHVYNGGLDVTSDYNGETSIAVDVCSKQDVGALYSLSEIIIDDAEGPHVAEGKQAHAIFTLSGLSDQERNYYTLSNEISCPAFVDVTPATLSLVADGRIVGREYNGSRFIAADIVTPPVLSYPSYDGTEKQLPVSSVNVVSATMEDKNVGDDKTADAELELNGDYARDFRFDNGTTSLSTVISGISITKLLVQLDGAPTVSDKVNDGTGIIPETIVTLPNITNVQTDDSGVLDIIGLQYDADNSYINEFDSKVGHHTSTITLALSGDDAGNYELIPSVWSDVDINILPVTLSVRGSFSSTESRVYDAKKRLDISKISVPELVFPDGTVVDPNIAHVVVTKAEMLTKEAGDAKETVIEFEISNSNFSFDNGQASQTYSDLLISNAPREVILTPESPVFPDSKVYDCSPSIEMRSVPVIDNVQVNEDGLADDLSYTVVACGLDNVDVGQRKALFEISLDGSDKGNYVLPISSWTDSVDVTPAALSLDTVNVKLDSHVYNCSSDVTSDFIDKANVMTIAGGLASCDADAYIELVGAVLNNADAGSRRTTLTFELRGALASNYGLSNAQLVKVVETDVLPASLEIESDFKLDSVAYSGSTDITEQFEATRQVPQIISGLAVCDESASFKLVSATLDDPTPGPDREVKLVFTLKDANAKNYGLTEQDTVFTISTTVTPKLLSLRGEPKLPSHVYDASIDVSADFIGVSIPVCEGKALGDDVRLSLLSATLDNPNVGQRKSTLVFTLTGDDAWKYRMPDATFVVSTDVTPRQLTLGADAAVAPRGYDATNNVPFESVSYPTLNGVLDVDAASVWITLAEASLDDSAIGDRIAMLRFDLLGEKAYDYVLVPDTVFVPTQILDTRKQLVLDGLLVVDDRVYDTTVDIADDLISLPSLVGLDEEGRQVVSLSVERAYFDAPDAGERIATVEVKLSGERSDFYKLDDYVLTANAAILLKEVTLAGDITIDSRRSDGTLAVDSSLIHLPGLDGVFDVDTDDVTLVVNSAVLDSASVGLRNVTLELSLSGSKAHNYKLIGAPFVAQMTIKAADRRRGSSTPRYYSLDGRFVGEGKDFVITTPGLYIKVVGRHAERIIVR